MLKAQAVRNTKLRGGVLADVMGRGKTATTIALISDPAKRIVLSKLTSSNPHISAATLLWCPCIQVSWVTEVRGFITSMSSRH